VQTVFFDQARYADEASALAMLEAPDGGKVLGVDLTAPAHGLAALIAARRRGYTTAVYPLLPDPLERLVAQVGQSIASQQDLEQRSQHIAAFATGQLVVNGRKLSEAAPYEQKHLDAAVLALRLADLVLLGAPGERDRWSSLLGRPLRRFSLLPTPHIEAVDVPRESGVTLYAPLTDRALLAHYILLLRNERIEPEIICAGSGQRTIRTRVVVAPEWRPMQARLLAAAGYRVVAPNTKRVDECDSRIFGFVPTNYLSFASAVQAACVSSEGGERTRSSAATVKAAIEAEKPAAPDGPCVSVIIRTHDRPVLLKRAIASVAAQTYNNVEIVVVNNGGPDVHEIVKDASAGRAYRYEVLPESKPVGVAANTGARAATGEYIGYLDDDDILYADHCARTVEALQRSEADVVFTVCLAEYANMRGDEKSVLGYQIYIDREFNLDDLYILNVAPIHSMVHRRSVFERFGFFDDHLTVTEDWEFWLRVASRGGRFFRVDRVTCEYSWRNDPERGNSTIERQWDFVAAYKRIIERYAGDLVNRPSIIAAQANVLAQQEHRAREAADPAKRAEIVIASMSTNLVPVGNVDWAAASV
jgi:glycosyltransferase involved in cell wall biosynthesis